MSTVRLLIFFDDSAHNNIVKDCNSLQSALFQARRFTYAKPARYMVIRLSDSVRIVDAYRNAFQVGRALGGASPKSRLVQFFAVARNGKFTLADLSLNLDIPLSTVRRVFRDCLPPQKSVFYVAGGEWLLMPVISAVNSPSWGG